MFAQLNRKEKMAYSAIAAALLFGLSYVGAKKVRPAPAITIKELPAPNLAAPPPAPPKEVVVDVEGEVVRPGVYHLQEGARVQDALQEAGGPTADADTSKLNLAEVLKDAKQVMVPKMGTEPSVVGGNPAAGSKVGKQMPAPGSIDLNRATSEELQTIPGIGPTTAEKILQLRETRGRINDIDDLRTIRGFSKAKLDQIRGVFHL